MNLHQILESWMTFFFEVEKAEMRKSSKEDFDYLKLLLNQIHLVHILCVASFHYDFAFSCKLFFSDAVVEEVGKLSSSRHL
jgi:hypothetical protein